MKHYKFGYARVSTKQQNLDWQLDILQVYGVTHIYDEKMTGAKKNCPELTKLLDRVEEQIDTGTPTGSPIFTPYVRPGPV